MKTYTVMRQMQGDKDYRPGDTRQLADHEAAPLLASGALVLAKAEVAVRETKVERGRAVKAAPARAPAPVVAVVQTPAMDQPGAEAELSAASGDVLL